MELKLFIEYSEFEIPQFVIFEEEDVYDVLIINM